MLCSIIELTPLKYYRYNKYCNISIVVFFSRYIYCCILVSAVLINIDYWGLGKKYTKIYLVELELYCTYVACRITK